MRDLTKGNGWTGGQYSLFRVIFGIYLLIHFVMLIPWADEMFSSKGVLPDAGASPLAYLFPNMLVWFDQPGVASSVLISACVLCGLFIVGKHDRIAAIGLWYIWACLLGRNPLITNPGIPYVGWMLVAHAFMPAAPFGSLAARGRISPAGGWRMPESIFAIAWILMAAGYSYSGYTKLVSQSWLDGTAMLRVLENPLARPTLLREWLIAIPLPLIKLATWSALALELLFAPLVMLRALRPWLWLLLLVMHVSLMTILDFADLSLGMIMLHLFTFNPNWLAGRVTRPIHLFYDGHCGLCHRCVRFVLAEDLSGRLVTLSPLDSQTFRELVPPSRRTELPDSIAVQTSDGRLFTRSSAVLCILDTLGGYWRVIRWMGKLIPQFVLDRMYDGIASIRHRLFATPTAACPIIPPHLRERFRM